MKNVGYAIFPVWNQLFSKIHQSHNILKASEEDQWFLSGQWLIRHVRRGSSRGCMGCNKQSNRTHITGDVLCAIWSVHAAQEDSSETTQSQAGGSPFDERRGAHSQYMLGMDQRGFRTLTNIHDFGRAHFIAVLAGQKMPISSNNSDTQSLPLSS